jgi:hypothetical protein
MLASAFTCADDTNRFVRFFCMKKIAYLVIVVAIIWFGWSWIGSSDQTQESTDQNIEQSENTQDQVTISIATDDTSTPAVFGLDYTAEKNLFIYLQLLEARGDITMQYKDYGGEMGVFIQKINNAGDDGSNKWWQYWINGKYANVGVSGYMPAKNDSIEFRYTDQHPEE